MDTRALRFHGPGDLRMEETQVRVPRTGDVVIAVEACGVCGSDLHFLDGSARPGQVPVTLGHEIVGRVAASRHPDWAVADEIVVSLGAPCGRCGRCREGRPNLCDHLSIVGVDEDGGFADLVTVPGDALVARPSGLSAAEAATAVDAGATAYHAVVRRAGVTAGDAVVIIGAGGLGGYAVQIAKAQGAAPIIVADHDPAALERARTLGADEVVVAGPGASTGREVRLITDGGADAAIEFVGSAAAVDAAVKSLRPGGRAVAVGVGCDPLLTMPPVLWAVHEYELVGSFASLPGDAAAILARLADGRLIAPPLRPVALDDAASAILRLVGGPARTGAGARLVVGP